MQEQNLRQEAKGGKPNIIVILTDDQRADTLEYMPNVKKDLAKNGVTFDNFISSTPLCCPARASFLSGLYVHNNGIWGNNPPNGGYKAFKDKSTIGVWMSKAGYRTGFIGKYLNHYTDKKIPPGWDEWYGRVKNTYFGYILNENGKFVEYGFAEKDYSTDVYKNIAINFINGKENSPNDNNAKDEKNSDSNRKSKNKKGGKSKKGVKGANDQKGNNGSKKPFFLVISVDAPHTDGGHGKGKSASDASASDKKSNEENVKARYAERADQNASEDDDDDDKRRRNNEVVKDYYAMPAPRHKPCKKLPPYKAPSLNEDTSDKPEYISSIRKWKASDVKAIEKFRESQVCALQAVDEAVEDILKALGPERKNTAIFFLSDNGYSWGDHRWGAKNCEYQVCIKVPLVISYPKMTKKATVSKTFAEMVDVSATIADLGGAKTPKDIDGQSLVPLLKNENAKFKDAALIEIRRDELKGKPKDDDYGIVTENYKYVESGTCEKQLYDLKKDPHELENQINNQQYSNQQYSSVIDQLQKDLEVLKRRGGKGKATAQAKANCKDKDKQKDDGPNNPDEQDNQDDSEESEDSENTEEDTANEGNEEESGETERKVEDREKTVRFSLTAFLHGIGRSGDALNPQAVGNASPRTTEYPFLATIYAGEKTIDVEGAVRYDKAKGAFIGSFSAVIPDTENITLDVKIPRYLTAFSEIDTLPDSGNVTLPELSFVSGDVNNDDVLDILDFNLIAACFSQNDGEICDPKTRKQSDLDDNDIVGEPDVNLYLRELSSEEL